MPTTRISSAVNASRFSAAWVVDRTMATIKADADQQSGNQTYDELAPKVRDANDRRGAQYAGNGTQKAVDQVLYL